MKMNDPDNYTFKQKNIYIQKEIESFSYCTATLVSSPHPAKVFTSSVLLCTSRRVFVYRGSQIVLLSLTRLEHIGFRCTWDLL